eukprot:7075532-Prymnesium_polylepis.1
MDIYPHLDHNPYPHPSPCCRSSPVSDVRFQSLTRALLPQPQPSQRSAPDLRFRPGRRLTLPSHKRRSARISRTHTHTLFASLSRAQ